MSNWLDLSSTSNRHIRTYVQGFLDISGGDLIVRNNKLIVDGGDSSLNGRVLVGGTLYPTGGINLQNNLTMGGLINQSGTTMAGGIIYQPLLPEDVSAVIYSSRLYYNNMSGDSTTFTIGNVSSSVVIGLSGNPLTVSGPLYTIYDTSINGRLFVGGDASLNSRLFVGSDSSLNSRLFLGGDASLNGNVYIGKDLLINGNLNVKQYTTNFTVYTVSYELIVAQDMSLNGRLFLYEDASMNKRLFVGGDISTNGNLFALSDASFSSRLFVGSDVSMNKRLFVGGDINTNGNVSIGTSLANSTSLIINKLSLTDDVVNQTTNTYYGKKLQISASNITQSVYGTSNPVYGGDIEIYSGSCYSSSTNNGDGAQSLNGGNIKLIAGGAFLSNGAGASGAGGGATATIQNQGVIKFQTYSTNRTTTGGLTTTSYTLNTPMTISGTNVGISTTSPAYTLDVAGTINTNTGYNLSYSSLPTFTSNMIGYKYSGSFISTTFSGWTKICNDITVTYQGVYMVTFTMRNGAYSPWAVSIGTFNSGDNNELQTSFNYGFGSLSGVFTLTTSRTLTVYAMQITGTGNIDTNHIGFSLTRIA